MGFVKKDPSVGLRGGFKESTKPRLQVDQYPLPEVEDTFTAMAGGQHFSKPARRPAYLQLPVEEASNGPDTTGHSGRGPSACWTT